MNKSWFRTLDQSHPTGYFTQEEIARIEAWMEENYFPLRHYPVDFRRRPDNAPKVDWEHKYSVAVGSMGYFASGDTLDDFLAGFKMYIDRFVKYQETRQ